MKNEPLKDKELHYLEQIFEQYSGEDGVLSVTELDGFLTAIISGPNEIALGDWLPVIWGSQTPQWKNDKEFEKVFGLIVQMMNYNAFLLTEHPDDFSALFPIAHDGDEQIVLVDDWCEGYMRGSLLWSDLEIDALPEDIQLAMGMIASHAGVGEDEDDVFADLSIEEQKKFTELVEPSAKIIHAYFLQQRNPSIARQSTAQRRVVEKVGRNDPCPCGSGKKFKQCCLH